MKANTLTSNKLKTLAKTKGKRTCDGRGLHFDNVTGYPKWTQRIFVNGKASWRKLGDYPEMTLDQARDASAKMRAEIKAGKPIRTTRVAMSTTALTFGTVAEQKIATADLGKATEKQWRQQMGKHASGLMAMPIADIATADLVAMLTAPTMPDSAKPKMRQRVDAIFKFAWGMSYITDNPASRLDAVLTKAKRNGDSHHEALEPSDVAGALATVRTSKAGASSKAAILFTVLTAARSAEVTGATWGEIDLSKATWTIPASRMKMGKAHRVPLSKSAMALIADLTPADERNADAPLFPGKFASGYMTQAIRRMGIASTLHGFRASFSTWAREAGVDTELREMCLAHAGDKAVRAYQRSDMLDARRAIMANWERHCMG